MKERPEWLTKSTVHKEEAMADLNEYGLNVAGQSQTTKHKKSLDTG